MKIILEPFDITGKGEPLQPVQEAVECASVVAAPMRRKGFYRIIKNRYGRCPLVNFNAADLAAFLSANK